MSTARFTSTQQVFEAFPTLPGDLTAAATDELPLIFLDKLAATPTPEDAVSFSAYLLPKREAVWWASQCVRQMGSPVNRAEEVALLTAEAWVRDPEEHRRVAALDLGLNGDHKLPGSWVALAAGGAGGTMTIGQMPGPPVPVHLCARAARSAVLIALARMPFRERPGYIVKCVALCRKLYEPQSA